MKKFLLSFLLLFYFWVMVAQPSISPSKAEFDIAEPKVFNFKGGTGSPTDWVGVYPVDTIPDGTPPSIIWLYVASDSGSVSLVNGVNQAASFEAGTYAVHLLCCDGYDIIASSTFKVVGAAPAKVNTTRYPLQGDSIEVEFSGGTGAATDWIGIYDKGAVPGTDGSLVFEYVNGLQAGTKKLDASGLDVNKKYDLYLFCCDGYDDLARDSFVIYEKKAPSLKKVGNFNVGGPFVFDHAGGTGSFADWVGVYNAGDTPGPVPSISYRYVNAPNGTLTFDNIPELVEGKKYDAHFFCCDDYIVIASVLGFELGTSSTSDGSKVYFKAAGSTNGAILFFDQDNTRGTVTFTNSLGQRAKTLEVSNQTKVSVDQLTSGMYIVQFDNGSKKESVKIVVR